MWKFTGGYIQISRDYTDEEKDWVREVEEREEGSKRSRGEQGGREERRKVGIKEVEEKEEMKQEHHSFTEDETMKFNTTTLLCICYSMPQHNRTPHPPNHITHHTTYNSTLHMLNRIIWIDFN